MEPLADTEFPPSVFATLYKYESKNFQTCQQKRREKFLKEQKEKRQQVVDKHRQYELFFKELDVKDDLDPMEWDSEEIRRDTKFKFKLMQSEWFTEIPENLGDDWVVKYCPQGFRVLLIAKNHTTVFFNIKGRIVLRLKTKFPGGGSDCNGITVLDCIFNKPLNAIFVLDALFWNSMSLLESEVNFRFYWLRTKFEENPSILKCGKYSFSLLEHFPAQRPLIQDQMFQLHNLNNNLIPYDGVVFYHKESHYTFGYTPLVGWLASYMLPEILNIDVCLENQVKKPKDYTCLEKYLQNLCQKSKNYKTSGETKSVMDVL